jgi:hypothetical protein
MLSGVDIYHERDDTREEEQHTDSNCNPSDGVVWIFDEQDANSNGADGTENGTL